MVADANEKETPGIVALYRKRRRRGKPKCGGIDFPAGTAEQGSGSVLPGDARR
ncbi:hypothetical protein [Sandaracinobacteroides saxicola]|uniref:Uncharacterized protein n=1 Tax=Sandaracinobacteroides saxicola TaxID=2759707 RepID=A0A7G5IN12_9SPHN|nr:hypothetical protein [Sandaracinobacteroides saxicola]QMW24754.1 hypothetical protein H3309_03460 [Sandaracinobacteroides saxicola]